MVGRLATYVGLLVFSVASLWALASLLEDAWHWMVR